jgi:indole-3-glycerol phosphate synthase
MEMDILAAILGATRQMVDRRMADHPVRTLSREVDSAEPARDFAGALRQSGGLGVIAEMKKASPSRGDIGPDVSSAAQAAKYETGGADAISVLTEETYFKGSIRDLQEASRAVSLPVLRKDFIIDEYQLYEARANGADAVLLIAAILTPRQLAVLHKRADDLELCALVEVHNEDDLAKTLDVAPKVIGINNRDLTTFRTDLSTTERLRPFIPIDVTVVSESGIDGPAAALRVKAAGAGAVLVGEALMKSKAPGALIKQIKDV